MCIPTEWKPVAVEELQQYLGSFTEWTLCGGCSLDLIVGKQTRPHGDIDVGVFRSQLISCLCSIGKEQVFLCHPAGAQVSWNGETVDPAVHDIWISDPLREHWLLQIMVFDDDGETVFYRRDRRICWPKRSHSLNIGDVQVLNPFITFLFKANKAEIEMKEVMDIAALIAAGPNQAMQRTADSSDI
jgi:aminoglycoside-2''-adenylyltransferase